jgi:excisionase family DNA binding protein
MEDNVMTTTEAVKYLKTSKKTFLGLVHEGKIRGNRFGKGYRFLKDELDNYLRREPEDLKVTSR